MTKLIAAIQLFLFSCAASAVDAAPQTQFGGKWAGAIFILLVMIAVLGTFIWVMFFKKEGKKIEK